MSRMSVLFALALTAGCVSTKKHNATLEALAASEDRVGVLEDQIRDLGSEAQELSADLNAATGRADQYQALANVLTAKNATLQERLGQVQKSLEELSVRSSAERQRKAELESLLQDVSADLEATEEAAAEAEARVAALAAEADKLREEKQALQAKTQEYDDLVSSLEEEITAGTVKVTELSGKLVVELSNAILFASGKYDVKDDGTAALQKVAGVLSGVVGREIRVEGHTDDVPVGKGAPYADNWALSSLRASAVVAILVDAGVDADRIGSVGFGAQRPIAPNDSEEGRASNRRTEIVLVPRLQDRRVSVEAEAPVESVAESGSDGA